VLASYKVVFIFYYILIVMIKIIFNYFYK
jgi:hypothetical protein